jgi:hypothetical protein
MANSLQPASTHGHPGGKFGSLGVFTKLTPFCQFIAEHTKNEVKCERVV